MSLFVLSSKDGWVSIMYQGIDGKSTFVRIINRFLYFSGGCRLAGSIHELGTHKINDTHNSFQPIENYNEWRMIYFIAFLLLVGFFVLNMFVGVVVENFHKCKETLEAEMKEKAQKKRLERKLKMKQSSSQQIIEKLKKSITRSEKLN